jgi:hypothetical protein
MKKIAAGTY